MADRLARDLAARGMVIVSGRARGIDAIAHHGTMDRKRPRYRRSRYGRGCLLPQGKQKNSTKKYWSVAPSSASFCWARIRRRKMFRFAIASWMPLGAIIIEGAQYSGPLITERLALQFGREVFGVPGNVTQAASCAPNF